jgi:hypothetical protein
MKKGILFFVLAAIIASASLFGQTDQYSLYKRKIESYSKTKNVGTVLIIAGVITTAIGTATLVSYLNDQDDDGYYDNSDNYSSEYYLGVYGTGIGVDMIIGGVVLNTIGSRKVRQYQSKLNNLSAGIRWSPDAKGFSLTYKF